MFTNYGKNAIQKSKIRTYQKDPAWDSDFETIERKGVGHPDTIADMLAAAISRKYSLYTIEKCDGMILHHQIDKLMVIGGKTTLKFGQGKFIEPIKIIVAGRATYDYLHKQVPVDKIIRQTIKSHFAKYFPLIDFNKDVVVQNYLTNYAGPGTIESSKGAIANMFSPKERRKVRGYEELIANDTSCCIAYAPYSELEKAVITLENHLNDFETKKKYRWLGTDIKIMAIRDKKNIRLTACIPQIAKYVGSIQQYKNNLKTIETIILTILDRAMPGYSFAISLNTKDNDDTKNYYLTVSGASLSGDIGAVGRGNRTNGLITANRPMSLEGTNGKNPRYYSGFIYANAAKRIANRIHKRYNKKCLVEIVSQNGGPLKRPWSTRVVANVAQKNILAIVNDEYKSISKITNDFINGNIINY